MIPIPSDESDNDWLARTHDEIELELSGLHAHQAALEATLAETRARAADAEALRTTWQWSVAAFLSRLSPRARRQRRAAAEQARGSATGTNPVRPDLMPPITGPLDAAAIPAAFDLIVGEGLTAREIVASAGPHALANAGVDVALFHGWDESTHRLITAPAAMDFSPGDPGRSTLAICRREHRADSGGGANGTAVILPVIGFTAAQPASRVAVRPARTETARASTTVSVVVPTRDQPALLRDVIATVEAAAWNNVELVLVDNGSTNADALALLASSGHAVVRDDGPFNFPRLIRRGVDASRGEVIVILNNDITSDDPDWLAALLECLSIPGCGVAGALLTYPDGRIQHCGIALDDNGPLHPLQGLPLHRAPIGLTTDVRPWWAVTGACMAFTRHTWHTLGGMELQFAHNYNDVDFCLRARSAGLETRCTPLVPLVHHESASRGDAWDATAAADWILFRARWRQQLREGDQYWPEGVDMTTGALV